jgi:hypothetical protein
MFYLKPCIEDIRSTNTDIEALELQKSASEQQKTQADNLQAQVDEMGAQLTFYGDSVTHTFDQPAVLSYLSTEIGKYAAVAGLQFERATSTDIIEQYEITVTMITTYDQLKQVLDTLEDSPYLIRISQLPSRQLLPTRPQRKILPLEALSPPQLLRKAQPRRTPLHRILLRRTLLRRAPEI